MKKNIDWSLTLVTDRRWIGSRKLEDIVSEAALGGISAVQLREKDSSTHEFMQLARRLQSVLLPLDIPLIINDRIDIALAVNAAGVHIGQTDMPYKEAREKLGPDKIIGLSVENFEQAAIAESYDVDYLGVSPIFETSTKSELQNAWGLANLRELRRLSRHKLIAIGGIHLSNVKEIFAHGADGLAVVSEICASLNPRQSARNLREAICDAIRTKVPPRVLTIACSDSGGGAGVEADLKTISALGCYGMSCFTALSAQNTVAVNAFHEIPPEFVRSQLEAVLSDIGVDAVKIGVVYGAKSIEVIANCLREFRVKNIVVDPVMVSKSGHSFVSDETVQAFKTFLFPIASVVTPNLPEASQLLSRDIFHEKDMLSAAKELLLMGPEAVLLKGGHADGPFSTDLLVWGSEDAVHTKEFTSRRFHTRNTHGTGCTFSSAIASYLARGFDMQTSVCKAKDYISGAIEAGQRLQIGKGYGPVHHFYRKGEHHHVTPSVVEGSPT